MSDVEPGAAPAADRGPWLRDLRRVDEQQEDALAGDFDTRWGEIEPTHQVFVERFLARLPPDGRVLDAACGTGKYFPMVLASGRRLLGVDHAGGHLTIAAAKFPQVPTDKHDLQDLPYQDEFDGVLCVDAMEFVPPEDWPVVLERFRRALRSGGWLYLTVELAPDDRVRAANQAARRSGLPVVDGEVMPGRARSLLPLLPEHAAGPSLARRCRVRHPGGDPGGLAPGRYAYHHVLARVAAPPG